MAITRAMAKRMSGTRVTANRVRKTANRVRKTAARHTASEQDFYDIMSGKTKESPKSWWSKTKKYVSSAYGRGKGALGF